MVFEVLVIFLVGLTILLYNSKHLVDVLVRFSRKARLKEAFIGSFILGIGTSLPEIIDSIIASVNNSSELALGLIIGSNITNLFLILGTSILITKNHPIKKTNKKDFLVLSLITMVFYVALMNNVLSRFEGLLFLVLFVWYNFFFHKNTSLFNSTHHVSDKELQRDGVITFISVFSILLSAWIVVNSSLELGSILNISPSIIGLIVLSFATSLPELITTVISSKKHLDLSIGNILGSNIANLLLAGGLSALINPLTFSSSQISFGLLFLLLSTIGISILFNLKSKYDKIVGMGMIFVYIVFLNIVYLS